jgi:hypothetical protein
LANKTLLTLQQRSGNGSAQVSRSIWQRSSG